MKRIAALWPYLARHPLKLAVGLLAILGAVVVGLAAPLIVGRGVDAFMADASGGGLSRYAAALVLVAAIQGLFSFAQRRVLVALSRDVEYELRNDFYAHLQNLPQAFFHRSYTGDLMARATNDLQAVRMVCGPAIMYSANTVFTTIGALLLMARIHLPLTLLALATMPLVALVTQVFGKKIHHLFERVQEQFARLSTSVQENLAGARVVRAYAREESEIDRFLAINREYVNRNKALIRWSAAFHPLLQVLIGFGFVAVLWYGGDLARGGGITVGEFVTFNFFLAKMIWPMIAVGWVINLVQRGSASLARIQEILHTEPEVRDRPDAELKAPIRGEIEVRNLDLSLDGKTPILSDIELSLPAGRTLGVVGRTGSGKSTLLSLIPRLLDPPPGAVFVDGRDVCDLPLATLRAAIGWVAQEPFLFSATIAENIGVGDPQAGREELERAAYLAGMENDLELFPQGLDTVVGERGVTLSGGQKQRVTLARGILRWPRDPTPRRLLIGGGHRHRRAHLAEPTRGLCGANGAHRFASNLRGSRGGPDRGAGEGANRGAWPARRFAAAAGVLRGPGAPSAARGRARSGLAFRLIFSVHTEIMV